MRIYISGPITGTTNYMERFAAAEEYLMKEGYVCINPAKVNAGLPSDTTHEEYMKTSICMLHMCDAYICLKVGSRAKDALKNSVLRYGVK